MKPEAVLGEIAEQTGVCTRCKLHFSRKYAVPGTGNPHAEILFIGEGPGFHENQQGLPFVGQAGNFLNELLASINLTREDVFITNVVKCRPPSNRDPEPEELEACRPYLERQIAAINPAVIVTLGRFSMAYFIPNAKISGIHGRSYSSNGRTVIPMYHPAAALHQPSLRSVVQADFLKIPEILEKSKENKQDTHDLGEIEEMAANETPIDDKDAEQLSLF